MTDRPIIFSAPMIRALLDGRKTMTRRALKPQPVGPINILISYNHGRLEFAMGPENKAKDGGPKWWRPPAQCGDRLWCRESWRTESIAYDDLAPSDMDADYPIIYDADADWALNKSVGRRRAAMHMPRWASRLTLIVESVKVERLQDISETDAKAEGAPRCVTNGEGKFFAFDEPNRGMHKCGFAGVWATINGQDSWDANPWACCLSFRVIKANIDSLEAKI
jgi:hypothetical protein